MAGFEPATSWSQTKRDTGLRYIPKIINQLMRRVRDSNPRYPYEVRQFSKRLLSASQSTLQNLNNSFVVLFRFGSQM